MNKPRSDSMLDALEEDQKRELCEWLLTPGLSYKKVRALCGKGYGVYPSDSQLSRFYSRYVAAELLARRRLAVSVSDEIAADAEKTPGRFDVATIEALKQKAFELASAPLVNPKDVKAVFALVLKARDQDLKIVALELERRKVVMAEARSKAADAVTEAAGKLELTPEVVAKILEAVDKRLMGEA